MTIGERIKKRRVELDLTASDLADELGKSKATIYRYENGDIKNMPTTILEPLADVLCTTPGYLMGWTDDPDDWERIANAEGICPPNDYDGDPESWYNMKIHAAEDHEREENELIKAFINDSHFEELASSYLLLNSLNKDRATNYAEKLLDIQRLEEQSDFQPPQGDKPHLEPIAAHHRTDINEDAITEEMKQHDMDIMDDPDF